MTIRLLIEFFFALILKKGENPIFKHATTTFKNPIYGGKGGSAIKNSSHTALLNSVHSNSSHGMHMNSGHGTVVKGH